MSTYREIPYNLPYVVECPTRSAVAQTIPRKPRCTPKMDDHSARNGKPWKEQNNNVRL